MGEQQIENLDKGALTSRENNGPLIPRPEKG
jgi:hypothetical protein